MEENNHLPSFLHPVASPLPSASLLPHFHSGVSVTLQASYSSPHLMLLTRQHTIVHLLTHSVRSPSVCCMLTQSHCLHLNLLLLHLYFSFSNFLMKAVKATRSSPRTSQTVTGSEGASGLQKTNGSSVWAAERVSFH